MTAQGERSWLILRIRGDAAFHPGGLDEHEMAIDVTGGASRGTGVTAQAVGRAR